MKHYHKILLPDSVADSFAIQKGNREFTYVNLASEKRYCLEVKRTDFDEIEIGFTLRALLNCKIGDSINLSKPSQEDFKPVNTYALKNLFRTIVSFNELALSRVLGAPMSLFLTSATYAGDEDRFLVRLHPSLFARLGAQPGDHVFIERMGRKIVAIAFEDLTDEAYKKSSHLAKSRAVGKKTAELPPEFPSYLLARISPQARSALGIPASDVSDIVTVKRRVQTKLLSQFNKILLPITVLILTIGATDWAAYMKLVLVAILIPIIVSISLAPIKVRSAPEGFWK